MVVRARRCQSRDAILTRARGGQQLTNLVHVCASVAQDDHFDDLTELGKDYQHASTRRGEGQSERWDARQSRGDDGTGGSPPCCRSECQRVCERGRVGTVSPTVTSPEPVITANMEAAVRGRMRAV